MGGAKTVAALEAASVARADRVVDLGGGESGGDRKECGEGDGYSELGEHLGGYWYTGKRYVHEELL